MVAQPQPHGYDNNDNKDNIDNFITKNRFKDYHRFCEICEIGGSKKQQEELSKS